MVGRADGGVSPSLDDFKHVKLLGEGAFAAVYKVIRYADGGTYALKKVKLPSLSDREKQNALNEIRLLASVQHENIISYKDAFFDDKTRCLCIVTECADHGDLMAQITRCQKEHSHVPESDLWRYLIGLAHALQALHKVSIFHRDMKSANIFLGRTRGNTIAKLGDFNVSTVAKRGLCMTQTGTPYYASPEIWRDTPYDGMSDIWGLGCVIYEVAALKPPFTANDMDGLCQKVLRGKYKRIPDIYSKELSDVIGAMLQVNPRFRPSAEQLLQLPVVRRKATELDLADVGMGESDLLATIKMPRKLIDLSDYMPKSHYEDRLDELNMKVEKDSQVGGDDESRRLEPIFKHDKRSKKQPKLPSIFDTPGPAQRKQRGRHAVDSLPPSRQPHEGRLRRKQQYEPSDNDSQASNRGGRGSERCGSAHAQDLLEPQDRVMPLKSRNPQPPRLHLPRIASCPGQLV